MVDPMQDKWACWGNIHNHDIPISLFKLKDKKNINVRNTDNYSSFNMMLRPFIHCKKAFSDTFYKCGVCGVGTKSNDHTQYKVYVSNSSIRSIQ